MRFIIKIIIFVLLSHQGISQTRELIIKAALIEKLTSYIEWNDDLFDEHKEFVIGIVGNKQVVNSISNIYNERKIKAKNVRVELLCDPLKINNYDLIFLTGEPDKIIVDSIIKGADIKPLVITDFEIEIEKSHLQLILEEGKINFKLNVATFESTNFTFSYLLLNYARNDK